MFGIDDIIDILIKQIAPSLITNVANSAINNAMAPTPPKPSFGVPGFSGGMQQPGMPPPGQAQGGGTATRPAAGMFAGGFTGVPPGGPNQGEQNQNPSQQGPGGFSTIDKPKQSNSSFSGGI